MHVTLSMNDALLALLPFKNRSNNSSITKWGYYTVEAKSTYLDEGVQPVSYSFIICVTNNESIKPR